MGKRGPPKKPTALRILEGNRSNRPLPKGEMKPRNGAPDPPREWPEAKQMQWLLICEELDNCGILTLIDGPALEMMVDALVEYREATEKVATFGAVFMEKGEGKIPRFAFSPYWTIANKAAKKLHLLLREFGMTPASRIATGTDDEGEDHSTLHYFKQA